MSRRLTTVDDLHSAGLVDAGALPELRRVAERYATAITPEMAALIDPDDPDDPIARQFIPTGGETRTTPAERADPIGDDAHSPVPGVVHRYPDRALLKVVHACPVYCRFCFRRESVGPGGDHLTGPSLDAALAYIRATPAIWEVILTGGDPLMLAPRRLDAIITALAAIDHVAVIRLHSRVPIVSPERIDAAMTNALTAGHRHTAGTGDRAGDDSTGAAVWVAIHTNHARELTPDARSAIARLADRGIPLVSQTVLLRGVNDDPAVLEALFRRLVANRVKPYYLHHGDFAPGTGHFRTGIEQGQAIVDDLAGRISGLCQPRYVLDIPGGHGKAPITPAAAEGSDEKGWQVRDFHGKTHSWPPVP
ncbi:lysine-2,3-aminomutase-like protein [Fodinicurvata sp. EGI_FJ10296]|uniref:lysine-2,3-aminomutase-like protein n=1 Tax=Fodinicurvata sp. EGI_FJ10296 TaxID=3231908 RepID=UPI003454E222